MPCWFRHFPSTSDARKGFELDCESPNHPNRQLCGVVGPFPHVRGDLKGPFYCVTNICNLESFQNYLKHPWVCPLITGISARKKQAENFLFWSWILKRKISAQNFSTGFQLEISATFSSGKFGLKNISARHFSSEILSRKFQLEKGAEITSWKFQLNMVFRLADVLTHRNSSYDRTPHWFRLRNSFLGLISCKKIARN